MKYLLSICLVMFLFAACNSKPAPKEESVAKPEIKVNADGLQMNPKYPNVPLAELGITVVNKDGWTTQQMDFHMDYCGQMMGSLKELDAQIFCECFLTKIQYYYEPRFFKEAYEDQQAWNRLCYETAQL